MAHKKAGGTTKNGRDSNGQRLGVKLFGSEIASKGAIIVRQRGTKMEPGLGVGMGRDYTIYAMKDGRVKFSVKKVTKYDGRVYKKTFVHVV